MFLIVSYKSGSLCRVPWEREPFRGVGRAGDSVRQKGRPFLIKDTQKRILKQAPGIT